MDLGSVDRDELGAAMLEEGCKNVEEAIASGNLAVAANLAIYVSRVLGRMEGRDAKIAPLLKARVHNLKDAVTDAIMLREVLLAKATVERTEVRDHG